MTPYYEDDSCTIYHGDCREILPTLYDAIVHDAETYPERATTVVRLVD